MIRQVIELALLAVVGMSSAVWAGIPEPDASLYGKA